jgi:hypothetical protein
MANDQQGQIDAAQAQLDRAKKLTESVQAQASSKPSGQHSDAPYSMATELNNKAAGVSKYLHSKE